MDLHHKGGSMQIEDINKTFVLRRVADTNFLVDISGVATYREPIVLNDVAADMYECLTRGESEEEIIKVLSSTYGVEQETIQEDLNAFREQLLLL